MRGKEALQALLDGKTLSYRVLGTGDCIIEFSGNTLYSTTEGEYEDQRSRNHGWRRVDRFAMDFEYTIYAKPPMDFFEAMVELSNGRAVRSKVSGVAFIMDKKLGHMVIDDRTGLNDPHFGSKEIEGKWEVIG